MNRKMNHEKNFEMREIKFRAKHGKEWVYGDLRLTSREPHVWTDPYTSHIINIETIGQYTGFKDKSDKEIYEGDIVDWTFFYNRIGPGGGCTETDIQLRGVIKWSNGGFVFEVWRNDFEDAGWYGISDLNFDPSSDIEVLGNIFDNPDLVEG